MPTKQKAIEAQNVLSLSNTTTCIRSCSWEGYISIYVSHSNSVISVYLTINAIIQISECLACFHTICGQLSDAHYCKLGSYEHVYPPLETPNSSIPTNTSTTKSDNASFPSSNRSIPQNTLVHLQDMVCIHNVELNITECWIKNQLHFRSSLLRTGPHRK